MSAQKRKIKAKPFVRDVRLGLGEEDLTRKYGLSRVQLYGVFQKLVNAGALDAMELYMRTSLSDTGIITFVAETVLHGQDGDHMVQSREPEPLYSETQEEIMAHVKSPAGDLFNTLPEVAERVRYDSGDREC